MSALVPKLVFVDPKTSVPDDPVRPLDKDHLWALEQQLRYDPQHTPCIGYYHESVLYILDGLHRRQVLIDLGREMMVLAFDAKPPQDYIERLKLTPNLLQKDIDDLSLFYAIKKYCADTGRSYSQAAEILRFDRSVPSRLAWLDRLTERNKEHVRARSLKTDSGIALAKGFEHDHEEQERLADEAVAGRLTAKQIRELAAGKNGNGKHEAPKVTWPQSWTVEQKIEWLKAELRKLGGK